ncbi:MAG TPA: MBOAT family O-acyltransferase, partial [Spirochaetia bacterium]|nr:MBOAT family O-acyltransferase [Spirochaetia bacterium]
MLFNSLDYFVFLPIVIGLYIAVPRPFRWLLILCAGYFFYAYWRVEYTLLIVFSTLVDYTAGRVMGASSSAQTRKVILLVSLGINIGLLSFFKYFNFLSDSIGWLLTASGTHVLVPHRAIVLPVGLSFYTFQSMAYTIEVYRRKVEPETHLGRYAEYVVFFPQLVAGPIERPSHLLPQLRGAFDITWENLSAGVQRILLGIFKKVVVADRLALFVNNVYASPQQFNGPPLFLATLFFAVQIYCDFSGYSDIAIGSARIFGVRLIENFERPYLSKSIGEFWSRWHIALSTWFRDYVYIPLGGNRAARPRVLFNLFVTFLISGLWHGASWTFVIWGAYHGLLVSLERLLPVLGRTPRTLAMKLVRGAMSFALVLVGWVFFRARSLGDALFILGHLG